MQTQYDTANVALKVTTVKIACLVVCRCGERHLFQVMYCDS